VLDPAGAGAAVTAAKVAIVTLLTHPERGHLGPTVPAGGAVRRAVLETDQVARLQTEALAVPTAEVGPIAELSRLQ
jgi:hypothetical protein